MPNLHDRQVQDSWLGGMNENGAFIAVADGIGGGPNGLESARTALSVISTMLGHSDMKESTAYQAVLCAQRSVSPWFTGGASGGCTLALLVVEYARRRVFACSVGDAQIYVGQLNGQMVRKTAAPNNAPLDDWLGKQSALNPWFAAWQLEPDSVLMATTDGVDLEGMPVDSSLHSDLISAVYSFERRRNGDDVAVSFITQAS